MTRPHLALAALMTLLLGCAEPVEFGVVVSSIDVFDGEADLGVVNLGLNGDTVAAISSEPLRGRTVVDGSGRYALPGLVNAHAHVWLPEQLAESFDAGVLATFDLYMYEEAQTALRAYRDSVGYANWHTSWYAATVSGGHATQLDGHPASYPLISDSLSPQAFVEQAVAGGAELIKIVRSSTTFTGQSEEPLPSLTLGQVEEIIDAADRAGLLTVVHISRLADAIDVARLEPSGLAHMWHDRTPPTREDLETLERSGVFIIPTMMLETTSNRSLDTDTARTEAEMVFEKSFFMYPDSVVFDRIKLLYDHGIPLVAGNDPPNAGINFGSDFLEELRIYASAGIPMIDVLRTATGNAARYLPTGGVGRISVGGPATFLIVDQDPVETLDGLEDIPEVWKNGQRVVRTGPVGTAGASDGH